MSKNLISNQKLIFRIISLLLTISIIFIVVSSIYIKQTALTRLAQDDAKKTSELIFEIMNTKMQEGWAKEDLKSILGRLEHIREGLTVHSYRSVLVEEILGKNEADSIIVKNDKAIQKAMQGDEQFIVEKDGSIRYIYPIHVKQECITCHYNAKVDDINGVLDITYPPSEIKISLNELTYWFIAFFILFILIFFYIFYLVVNKKIISPIVGFTNTIKELTKEKDLEKKANVQTNIEEIQTLQTSFNKLLSTIKYYYEKLLENLYHDSLTSLGNMNKLQQDLPKHPKAPLAILSIDTFREFNNFYGIKVGDFIIKDLAKFLKKQPLDGVQLYRLYGDEFALLFTNNTTVEKCNELINNISLHEFKYKNISIYIQVTMGIVFIAEKRKIEKATIALKNAKKHKKSLRLFKESILLQEEYEQHIKWTQHLKDAIEQNNILPVFQPIKAVGNETIKKYECLARVLKDGHYHVPFEFLEVAKKAKLYPKITQIMMEKTFAYFSDKKDLEFSINYSIDDIQNPQTTEKLFSLLEQYELGDRLIIELLETEEINDFIVLNNFITRAKKYKVRIAIDDFGSGYSNFSYLINMNIDYLKIDSSLIEKIDVSQDSLKVVKTIIAFAKELHLQTIAEKVHSEQIESILLDLGVDYLQGYHIGKPEPEVLAVKE